ncbi:MAG: DUF2971 domain-containing protein [Leptospirillum sp.]
MEWTMPMFRYMALNDQDKEDLESLCRYHENDNLQAAKSYLDSIGYKKDHRLAYLFKTKQLYRITPKDFNDPYDCLVEIDPNATSKDLLKSFRIYFWCQAYEPSDWQNVIRKLMLSNEALERYLLEDSIETFFQPFHKAPIVEILQKTLQEHVNKSRTICFSENPNNILMWAHYASKHEGYCFEFESVALKGINKLVGFYTVEYDSLNDLRPLINFSDAEWKEADFLKKIFLSKSKHWSYEEEIRMVYVLAQTYFEFNPMALKKVILGAEMPEIHKKGFQVLLEVLNENNSWSHVTFSEAKLDRAHFKVAVSPRRGLYEY